MEKTQAYRAIFRKAKKKMAYEIWITLTVSTNNYLQICLLEHDVAFIVLFVARVHAYSGRKLPYALVMEAEVSPYVRSLKCDVRQCSVREM